MREISKTTNTHASAGPLLGGLTRPVLVSAVFFMAVTGIAYPLATTGVATLFFPAQSRGSIVTADGKDVGSRVIGQYFTRPDYFHGRPSTTSGTDPNDPSKTVDQPYNAAASGASNQGAISKKLIEAVTERTAAYREENGLAANAPVPIDAVTASGSGLDPHISPEAAYFQVARVAKARNMDEAALKALVAKHVEDRALGVLGEPVVNVLALNMALDESKS